MLLLFGGFCLSWGGFIVRSFETSDAWKILLLRSFFFFLGVSVFLLLMYKKDAFKTVKKAGLAGLLGAKLNDERVLNQVILRSIKNKKIDVYGGLNQLRSNLFIYDAVNMMIKTIVKTKNQIFNLNNHKMITLGKIFSMIEKISEKRLVNHGSKMFGSPKVIRISNKKILKKTNYKISTDIREGLIKTINWYRNLSNTK